jgi:PAS domain-containing protein
MKGFECVLVDRNKGEIPVCIQTMPVRDGSGRSAGYILVAFDLRPLRRTFSKEPDRLQVEESLSNTREQLSRTTAARERAERELQSLEQNWECMGQLCPDGLVIVQDGVVKYANTNFARLWEAQGDPVEGLSLMECIGFDAIQQLQERAKDTPAAAGVLPAINASLKRHDGCEVAVELKAGPGSFGGKPAELVIVRATKPAANGPGVQESESSRVQESESSRVQESESLAAAPEPVGSNATMFFAVDREGCLTFRFSSTNGKSAILAGDVKGKPIADILPSDASRLTAQALERTRQKETVEYEYRIPNGRLPTWLRTRLTPVVMNGEYAGSFAEVWDISELKRKEQAEEIRRLNQELRCRLAGLKSALDQIQSFTLLPADTDAPIPELSTPLLTHEEYLDELPEGVRDDLDRTHYLTEEMQDLVNSLLASVKATRVVEECAPESQPLQAVCTQVADKELEVEEITQLSCAHSVG